MLYIDVDFVVLDAPCSMCKLSNNRLKFLLRSWFYLDCLYAYVYVQFWKMYI